MYLILFNPLQIYGDLNLKKIDLWIFADWCNYFNKALLAVENFRNIQQMSRDQMTATNGNR